MKFSTYFETGMGGSHWCLYEGSEHPRYLLGAQFLRIVHIGTNTQVFAQAVEFLMFDQAIRRFCLKPYIKRREDGTRQINIGGRWFHSIPYPADLVLLWEIAKYPEQYEVYLDPP